MQTLSWKEKYAGILVLLVSIIFLLLQVASLLSNTSHPYAIQNGAIVIDKNELYSDVRTWSIVVAGMVAGWLLLKGKQFGWVLGVPILLFVTIVLGVKIVEQVPQLKHTYTSLIVPGIILFFFFLALLFLLLPAARKRYRVSKPVVLLTLFLFAALGCIYIFLQ